MQGPYTYVYLIGSLLFVPVRLLLYWRSPSSRREMLIMSGFFVYIGAPMEALLYTRDWWHPATVTGTLIGFEDVLYSIGNGGYMAALYVALVRGENVVDHAPPGRPRRLGAGRCDSHPAADPVLRSAPAFICCHVNRQPHRARAGASSHGKTCCGPHSSPGWLVRSSQSPCIWPSSSPFLARSPRRGICRTSRARCCSASRLRTCCGISTPRRCGAPTTSSPLVSQSRRLRCGELLRPRPLEFRPCNVSRSARRRSNPGTPGVREPTPDGLFVCSRPRASSGNARRP